MPLVINEGTLGRTTKCLKNFSCLNGDSDCLCKVNYCMLGELHVIDRQTLAPCQYCVPFISSYVCTCPTRKEIHNRYDL